MAVLVAATETLLTPWNALEQYRYSYCNVASHSHQHVVQVDYGALRLKSPDSSALAWCCLSSVQIHGLSCSRFCACFVLPLVRPNPLLVLLHSCIADFQWSRWLFLLVMLDGYGYIFYVRLCGWENPGAFCPLGHISLSLCLRMYVFMTHSAFKCMNVKFSQIRLVFYSALFCPSVVSSRPLIRVYDVQGLADSTMEKK